MNSSSLILRRNAAKYQQNKNQEDNTLDQKKAVKHLFNNIFTKHLKNGKMQFFGGKNWYSKYWCTAVCTTVYRFTIVNTTEY